jgi:hypothetical protein
MILTDEQIIDIIKKHQKVCDKFQLARQLNSEMNALVEGINYSKELIERIEFIESDEKKKARQKYSTTIKDMFERLLMPIQNIFSASGGVKVFNIDNDKFKESFLNTITNTNSNKSVSTFIQDVWMNLYHTDPNGVIFIEYEIEEDGLLHIYPTYKSISSIRYYEDKGQLVDYILFEPKDYAENVISWRIVDDVRDVTVLQQNEVFEIVPNNTLQDDEGNYLSFEHPFGYCPTIIVSNLESIQKGIRVSAFDKVVDKAKEYARDTSVKTIFKFLHGFPTHWRYVTNCRTCKGTGKKDGSVCPDCDGHGYYKKKDITDLVTLPIPDGDGQKLAPDIAGYVSPDLETWKQFNEELKTLENVLQDTHWGTHIEKGNAETATGRFIDVQPVINKLNKYADVAEWVEWQICELIANAVIVTKPKTEHVCKISYGRRYIIDSPDTILKKYTDAKTSNANISILDRLLNEYITSKYSNDPEWLREELTKIQVEPYIHLSISDVNAIFGQKEAQRKNYFSSWWALNIDMINKDIETIKTKFNQDFELFYNQNNVTNN